MKIGITGASGHIGGNICRLLLADGGYKVRALIFDGHSAGIKNLDLEIVEGNVLNYDSLLQFMEGMDVIIHLAGKISIDGDPDGFVRKVNYDGSVKVIKACVAKNISKLIFFSSIHAMNPIPLDEELNESRELVGGTWKGSVYDRSKADAERYLLDTVKKTGLNAVIIAPTAVTGPYDFMPSLQGKAMLDVYHGKIPAIVKGGYDWVDVRDVARGTIQAIHHAEKGEKYILSGEYVSLKDWADMIAHHSPKSSPKIVLPVWVARLSVPFAKLQSKMTGKSPAVTHESLSIVQYSCKNMSAAKATKNLEFTTRPIASSIKDSITWFKQIGMIDEFK